MMAYKGYVAQIAFDDDAALFHGHVLHPRDVITFQGASVTELRSAFMSETYFINNRTST